MFRPIHPHRAALIYLSFLLFITITSAGCIKISPHHEIIDTVNAFIDAIDDQDIDTISKIAIHPPADFKTTSILAFRHIESVEIGDVSRDGEEAVVKVCLVSEGSYESGSDTAELNTDGKLILKTTDIRSDISIVDKSLKLENGNDSRYWDIYVRRVSGVWYIDLEKTLSTQTKGM